MVVPTFGFSVGDFIAGINIAVDVIKACKDTGGASSQYERIIVEFETYLALLRKLQDASVPTTAEITRLASSCERPVQQFVTKIEKYRCSLTKPASSHNSVHYTAHHLRTFPRKAQWATVAKKSVEELRLGIGPQLSAIGLLIELESSKVLMKIASAHQIGSALVPASTEATKQEIEHVEGNQVAQIDSIIKDSLSNVQFVMETVQKSVHEGRVDTINSHRQSNVQLSKIESQLSGLENLTRTIAEEYSQPHKGAAVIETIAQFRKGSDDSGELEQLDVYLIRIFDSLVAILRRWIIQTLLFLPYWRAFFICLRSIPATPTGLISDNITFTDVLGRKMSLSYADFRYWPVFQARLQVAFRGVPWEEKVREEQYRVLTHDLRIVDQQNWTDLVSPRSKLRMSIVIREVAFPDKICLVGDTLCKAVRTECLMMTACGERSFSANINVPVSFNHRQTTEMISARMENQRNTIGDSEWDWGCAVCGKPNENQRNFLEVTYVPDSVVRDKAPPSEDIQTQVLTAPVLGRDFDIIACKAALDVNIRGIVRGIDDPAWPRQVFNDLYRIPGRNIAAWFTRFKPGLDIDPIQHFQYPETSASTTAEPHMVLRETGSGWSLIVRKRIR